jgi:hypothetical protein
MSSLPAVTVLANSRQFTQIQMILRGKVVVATCVEWPNLLESAVATGWGIAWEEQLSVVALRAMRAAMHQMPRIPILLITGDAAENLVKLKDIVVAEVLITSAVSRNLPTALLTVRSSGLLGQAAAIIEATENLPLEIRSLLALPLRSAAPVRSLMTWSRVLGRRSESSLWRAWRTTPLAAVGLTPKDYLDWIDLARCAACKSPWMTWRAAAEMIGLRPERLVRVCARLTRSTPRHLGAAGILDGWLSQFGPLLRGRVQQL